MDAILPSLVVACVAATLAGFLVLALLFLRSSSQDSADMDESGDRDAPLVRRGHAVAGGCFAVAGLLALVVLLGHARPLGDPDADGWRGLRERLAGLERAVPRVAEQIGELAGQIQSRLPSLPDIGLPWVSRDRRLDVDAPSASGRTTPGATAGAVRGPATPGEAESIRASSGGPVTTAPPDAIVALPAEGSGQNRSPARPSMTTDSGHDGTRVPDPVPPRQSPSGTSAPGSPTSPGPSTTPARSTAPTAPTAPGATLDVGPSKTGTAPSSSSTSSETAAAPTEAPDSSSPATSKPPQSSPPPKAVTVSPEPPAATDKPSHPLQHVARPDKRERPDDDEKGKQAAKQAEKEARQAAKDAAKRAREDARDAAKKAREMAKSVREEARSLGMESREAAKFARDDARDAAKEAREAAKLAREDGRNTAKEVREAVKLSGDDARDAAKEAREAAKLAREDARDTTKEVREAAKLGRDDTRDVPKEARVAVPLAQEAAREASEAAKSARERLVDSATQAQRSAVAVPEDVGDVPKEVPAAELAPRHGMTDTAREARQIPAAASRDARELAAEAQEAAKSADQVTVRGDGAERVQGPLEAAKLRHEGRSMERATVTTPAPGNAARDAIAPAGPGATHEVTRIAPGGAAAAAPIDRGRRPGFLERFTGLDQPERWGWERRGSRVVPQVTSLDAVPGAARDRSTATAGEPPAAEGASQIGRDDDRGSAAARRERAERQGRGRTSGRGAGAFSPGPLGMDRPGLPVDGPRAGGLDRPGAGGSGPAPGPIGPSAVAPIGPAPRAGGPGPIIDRPAAGISSGPGGADRFEQVERAGRGRGEGGRGRGRGRR